MRADRLKLARERAGHTQESLAQLMNKQIKQIWRWESGTVTPSADALGELAKALNVSADYLLGLTDLSSGIMGNKELDESERAIIELYRAIEFDDQFMALMLVKTVHDTAIARNIGQMISNAKED